MAKGASQDMSILEQKTKMLSDLLIEADESKHHRYAFVYDGNSVQMECCFTNCMDLNGILF
jgi:hypothetical protein